MNAIQCRMARAATGLGVRDLAQRADVAIDTVTRLERGEVLKPSTIAAMQVALEAEGAIFVQDDTQGTFGVMLRAKATDS
jgi:transcriptional regulator with XRE-family HTH domain